MSKEFTNPTTSNGSGSEGVSGTSTGQSSGGAAEYSFAIVSIRTDVKRPNYYWTEAGSAYLRRAKPNTLAMSMRKRGLLGTWVARHPPNLSPEGRVGLMGSAFFSPTRNCAVRQDLPLLKCQVHCPPRRDPGGVRGEGFP